MLFGGQIERPGQPVRLRGDLRPQKAITVAM